MRNFLIKLKSKSEHLNYGRHIIDQWASDYINSQTQASFNILDVGIGPGTDLMNSIKKTDNPSTVNIFGIDSNPENIDLCEKKGITCFNIDVEKQKIPLEDGTLDLIIANQILEHTKEIFFICSEAYRALKTGGRFIIGVPNLASLHNRIALLMGQQPPVIHTMGPHVRGFTKNAFVDFIETNGYFQVLEFKGSNFYPFPPKIALLLSHLFPKLAVGSFYLIEKIKSGGNFIDVLDTFTSETPYYRGD